VGGAAQARCHLIAGDEQTAEQQLRDAMAGLNAVPARPASSRVRSGRPVRARAVIRTRHERICGNVRMRQPRRAAMLDGGMDADAAPLTRRRATVALTLASLLAGMPATAAADGRWTPARVISSALPEAPAIAVNAHGTAILAHADAGGAWVARLGRDGRPGRRFHVRGPARRTGIGVRGPRRRHGDADVAHGAAAVAACGGRLDPGPGPARAVAVSRPGWEPGPAAMISTTSGRAALAWTELAPLPGIPRPMAVRVAVVARGHAPAARDVARSAQQRLDRPAVGADANGRPTVSWTVEGWVGGGPAAISTSSSASAARFVPLGAPVVSGLDGSALDDLHVLTEPSGEQIAAWRVVDAGGDGRVMFAERAPGATFAAPQLLAAGRRISGLHAAAGAGGDVVAAWTATAGRLTPAFAAVRSPQGRWGAVQSVSARGRSGAGPAIAVDRHGRALLVWASVRGAVAARAQRGTLFGQRQTISAPRGRLCFESRLIGGAGGHAVASFACSAGSRGPLHELARFWP
jgi:hypothetical protein